MLGPWGADSSLLGQRISSNPYLRRVRSVNVKKELAPVTVPNSGLSVLAKSQ